jgi:hypothetical protein
MNSLVIVVVNSRFWWGWFASHASGMRSRLGFLFLRSIFGDYDGVDFELERWSVH